VVVLSNTPFQVSDEGELLDGISLEREVRQLSALFTLNEARLQDPLHVVRNRGLSKPKRLDEVADTHRFATARRKHVDDADTSRVAESLEQPGCRLRLLV